MSDLATSGGIDIMDIDRQSLFSMTRKERPPLDTFGKLDSEWRETYIQEGIFIR